MQRREFIKIAAAGVVAAFAPELRATSIREVTERMDTLGTGLRRSREPLRSYDAALMVSAAHLAMARADFSASRRQDVCYPDDGPAFIAAREPAEVAYARTLAADLERKKAIAGLELTLAAPLAMPAAAALVTGAAVTRVGQVVATKAARKITRALVKEAVKQVEQAAQEREYQKTVREIREAGDRARENFRARDVFDHYDARPDSDRTVYA